MEDSFEVIILLGYIYYECGSSMVYLPPRREIRARNILNTIEYGEDIVLDCILPFFLEIFFEGFIGYSNQSP